MAEHKSDQLTNRDMAPPRDLNQGTFEGGKARNYLAEVTLPTGVAQNDTVEMLRIPKGAVITSIVAVAEALGTSVTLAIGDGTTAGKYLAATAANTAGKNFAGALTGGALLTAEESIVLTLGGGTPTAAKKINLIVGVCEQMD